MPGRMILWLKYCETSWLKFYVMIFTVPTIYTKKLAVLSVTDAVVLFADRPLGCLASAARLKRS